MGLCCPVGLRWSTACAAIRAGLSGARAGDYIDDEGRDLTCATVPGLEGATRRGRWLTLLSHALHECLEPISIDERRNLPLILALPLSVSGQVPDATRVLAELHERGGPALNPKLTAVICAGSSGAFRALSWARTDISAHGRCLIAAADSLVSARVFLELQAQRRLLTEDNPDGFIPGEAAAAVLVHAGRGDDLASIRGLGFGQEPALLSNELPLRADGIVAATRATLTDASCAMHDIDLRLSDATGESYHFKEQALVLARVLRQRKPELPLLLPAESLGHTGTAAGLCGLVIAVEALASGLAPGPRVICHASNPDGERAAVLVEAVR